MQRSKDIDLKYQLIRDMVYKQEIEMKYCSTQNQLVDVFPKGGIEAQFLKLEDNLVNATTIGPKLESSNKGNGGKIGLGLKTSLLKIINLGLGMSGFLLLCPWVPVLTTTGT